METEYGMFANYVRSHRCGVLTFALMCGIAAAVFALYRLPVAAVGYAALLCAFAGLVILGLDYRRFRKKIRRLEMLKREITVTDDSLPEAEGAAEEQYQELLHILFREKEQVNVRAEQQYRDLTDYYSMWAHQIKTPIAASRLILQSAERAGGFGLSGSGKPREADCASGSAGQPGTGILCGDTMLQELREELLRIEQYTEMAMCYVRLGADSTDYVIREYDLDRIICQAVRRHSAEFIRRRLKLSYEPLSVRVVTDEKWLLFVIDQVLSNALKYTPSGSIGITLEQPKTLCIRDTGIGIAPEDLPRIFEKGYTGYNGRADKKASGIGLYLCKSICTNLGHRITASSRPGEGTIVRIGLENAPLEVE